MYDWLCVTLVANNSKIAFLFILLLFYPLYYIFQLFTIIFFSYILLQPPKKQICQLIFTYYMISYYDF